MELIEQIKLVKSFKATVSSWKNDFQSEEYKQASKLNKLLFDIPLNKVRNCDCVHDLFAYISGLDEQKIKQKQISMESNFKLKNNAVIQVHGLSIILTNANITDEKALQLLDKYPGHIVSFEKYPTNWKSLIGKKVVAEIVAEEEAVETSPIKPTTPKDLIIGTEKKAKRRNKK
jgi:hypothetical protein